ncbi:MAG: two-component system, NarL family, nitrate/nitrite response regulator NarL [bacterium]
MMPMPQRATVYVADDHPVFRDGLARAIRQRDDLELVGEAADGRTALAEIRSVEPDVALLDVSMPGIDGLEVLHAIARDRIRTTVVLLSAHVAPEVVYRSISMGAANYLTKQADRDEICDAVVAAARGETRMPPEVQGQLVRELRRHAVTAERALSAREQEVLRLIAEGLSAPEIAAKLVLSPATIRSHLQTLYDKLGVSERAAAVATAMRKGLLE